MFELRPGETLIHGERNISSGSIGWFGTGVNNAYDLYLIQNDCSNNYYLIIYMDLQFIFKDTRDNEWSNYEKTTFVEEFKKEIQDVWGGKLIKTLEDGCLVYNEIRFNTWIGGYSRNEHWEINVKKIEEGSFSISSVNAITNHVQLDSEDLIPTNKGHSSMQRGVVHEFGHMLGLGDEYKQGDFVEDYSSIMNLGESLRDRHRPYMNWLEDTVENHLQDSSLKKAKKGFKNQLLNIAKEQLQNKVKDHILGTGK